MRTIENALKIDGWMRPSELAWLAARAEAHTRIAEVGSWMGRSTRAIAENTPGTVFAIDTWVGSGTPEHLRLLKDKPEDWLFQQFITNMAGATNVTPVRGQSLTVAAAYASINYKFDMIFIDASHTYEDAKADILAWRPLLAEGGLLCGHDYHDWPSVTKAVDELIPNVGTMDGSIWEAK